MSSSHHARYWAAFASVLALSCSQSDDSKELLAALERNAAALPQAERRATSPEPNPRVLRRFEPLRRRLDSLKHPANAERIDLGRMLYYDARLSKDQDLSCNSCHDLSRYGVDNRKASTGHRGSIGSRNSPSVYNAAGFFVQFWDGRAPDVEEQAKGPITNPVEMAASSGDEVVRVLRSIPGYVEAFRRAFPGEAESLTFDNVGIAIAAFERGLTTRSRWDAYLEGKKDALSNAELEGLKVFTDVGCMVCHTGEFLGGSMYQKLGAVVPWPNQKDAGRYEITRNEADRMVFRVPSLRNVRMTAPYFHDGSAADLPEAVRMMGKHQLGLDLAPAEVAAITAWLDSLTGELPEAYIRRPALPASRSLTPKPKSK